MTENNEEIVKIREDISGLSEQVASLQNNLAKLIKTMTEKERKTASGAIDYIKEKGILTTVELGKNFPSFYNNAKFKRRVKELGEDDNIKFLEWKSKGASQLIVYRDCWEADQFVRLWTPAKNGIVFDGMETEERLKIKSWLEKCHLKERFIVDAIKATLLAEKKY